MASLNFQLVTPEKTVLQQELTSLSCPTSLGQITILAHHIPLVANLVAGELHAKTEKDDFFVYVSGGFVEVRAGNQVVVLADTAEHHYEIDQKAAEEAIKRAAASMKEKTLSGEEYAKVAATLERSLTRLNIVRKHSHRKQSAVNQNSLDT